MGPTSESTGAGADPDVDAGVDSIDRLEQAARDRERARERVDAVGEDALLALEAAVDDLRRLLDSYEERATGDGDFEAFIRFQEEIATFTEELDEDLPERETFETIDDRLQQRRLTESDFETVRSLLADAANALDPLESLRDATDRYERARTDARQRRRELRDHIDDLERCRRLGEADLEAPVEELREPIERYDEGVQAAFAEFRNDSSARTVLDLLATARHYPLVDLPGSPEDLQSFVDDAAVGSEPIPTLLEYADYSRSKLSHYVDDPGRLKRAVGGNETFLRRLDAEGLTIGWPPPPAAELRWLCRERVAVVARFEPDLVADVRAVRNLAFREDYERLRESAVARAELTERERERLTDGAVEADLERARAQRQAIEDALEEYPAL